MKHDLKIVNARYFDSREAKFSEADLTVDDGIISKIAAAGSCGDDAAQVIDAQGKITCPGLIDEHLHVDLNGSIIGANADTLCIPNGITTICDGGTCGASNFPLFYNSNLIRFEAHAYSYLNVSTFGNKSLCLHEEDHDPADFREDLIVKTFRKYGEVLRGLKIRMCRGTLGEHTGMAPLYRALEISERLQKEGFHCPLVVHYGDLPQNVSVAELFGALRKGDILAHVFQTHGETIFNDDFTIKKSVLDARERGVLMDDCHGRVHWSIPNLKAMLKENFLPDIISSDSVRISEYVKPGFSLLYAMNMLWNLGMKLEDVLTRVTLNPAKALGIADCSGVIGEGRCADITILDEYATKHPMPDMFGGSIESKALLVPLLTVVEGRVGYRQIFF